MKKSYGNTGTPITMDMGGFKVYYRNHVGGARQAFFKVADHTEARNETLNLYGGSIDESPVRIERMDVFGNHTHTWYSENIWDSCLTLQWTDAYENRVGNTREEYERQERRRYRRYSNRSGDRV